MMKRVLIIGGVVLVIAVILGYFYVYQDHRDIKSEEAAFTLHAKDLASEFYKDGVRSSQKYLNKTIQVYGGISEIETNAITLDAVVYATFDTIRTKMSYNLNEKIKVKGRCIGYDELLEMVKLDQVMIIP